ncbi:adenylate cyclase associated C terminal-domain-containing protein [Pelagophyceae sp. CCMP2097]|nr:adenylate cyclase associated C terminal-domain-containing protein [Pelagophyceae sp. CCMP2097]
MTTQLQNALDEMAARLAAVEAKLGVAPPPAAAGGASVSAAVEDSAAIKAYDAYSRDCLDPFIAACAALAAPEATACGAVVQEGWSSMRAFLVMASQCKKPSAFPAAVMPMLGACQAAMKKASDGVSRTDWEWHQKTVAEGLQALQWLVVTPAPKDFVENFVGGQDFWANKLRVKYRKTEPAHVLFCDTFKKLLLDLMPFVKEWHMTGVTFNPKGGDVSNYAPSAVVAVAAAALEKAAVAVKASAMAGLGDLKAAFAAKGNATAGLKTVTKDMQTWRSEYKGGAAPAPAAAKPKVVARQQTVTKGPPVLDFQTRGLKWMVENQTAEQGVITITIDPNEGTKHTVYICGCYGATIDIKGKCKGVAVDGCAKTNVLFDSCISSLEIVNSKSMKCQSRGLIPSVAIDKTDGICVYLSKESLPVTTFTTSKSSDMQIAFPDEEGEMVEAPIPEQFVHRAALVAGKPKVSSDVSDLYSH